MRQKLTAWGLLVKRQKDKQKAGPKLAALQPQSQHMKDCSLSTHLHWTQGIQWKWSKVYRFYQVVLLQSYAQFTWWTSQIWTMDNSISHNAQWCSGTTIAQYDVLVHLCIFISPFKQWCTICCTLVFSKVENLCTNLQVLYVVHHWRRWH